ncbi:MAG: hypothetical protein EB117_18505 [Betaproteobacteria bacterium]|nr:hypothetical protein [Betaproteobacteria bacterium]
MTILDQVDFQESAGFQASQDLVFRVTQGQASRAIRDLVYRDTQDYRAFLESADFRETVGLVEYPDSVVSRDFQGPGCRDSQDFPAQEHRVFLALVVFLAFQGS